jgi:hypothetical protein
MLQAGRSWVRALRRSLNFINLRNPSSRNVVLLLTQSLTEMRTRRSFCGKARTSRKAANLTAMCEVTEQCRLIYISETYRSPCPVAGIASLFYM